MSKRIDIGIRYPDKKIRLNFLAIVFLLTPFFKPGSFDYIVPALDTMFEIWKIAAAIVILTLYLLNGRFSKYILSVIAFEGVLILSTIINSGDMYTLIINVGKVISICMLVELGIHVAPKELVRAFVWILGIECIINAITVFLFPGGMYVGTEGVGWSTYIISRENYFLGYDNGYILYMLPFFCFYLIYSKNRNMSQMSQMALMLPIIVASYITHSAATVVALSVFVILVLLERFQLLRKMFKFRNCMIVVFIAFIAIVFFRLHVVLSPLIEMLGKDITLTGRTYVWDKAIQLFLQSPVIGIGLLTRSQYMMLLGLPHPHSFILRILCERGIIGFIFFIVILLLVGKSLAYQSQNRNCYIVSTTLFCFFIVLLTESFDDLISLFGILTVAYHISMLNEGLEGTNTNKVRCRLVFRRSVSFR